MKKVRHHHWGPSLAEAAMLATTALTQASEYVKTLSPNELETKETFSIHMRSVHVYECIDSLKIASQKLISRVTRVQAQRRDEGR